MDNQSINVYLSKPSKFNDKTISWQYSDEVATEFVKIFDVWFEENYHIDESREKVAVFYSGGYDSTALLIKNLQEGKVVYPIGITFNEDDIILKRVNLWLLRKIFPNQIAELTTVRDMSINYKDSLETCGFNQQPMCAFFAAFIPASILEKVKEIQVAYVIGDAAISFLGDLKNIYNSTVKFKTHKFKIPELVFPFYQTFHSDNVDLVNKFNLPCCAGDCTQYFRFGSKKSDSSKEFYIEVTDRIDRDRISLNKSGNIHTEYYIELIYSYESISPSEPDDECVIESESDELKDKIVEDKECTETKKKRKCKKLSK